MLPQQLINNFKTRQVVCMEYDLLSEEQEREIFQVWSHLSVANLTLITTP